MAQIDLTICEWRRWLETTGGELSSDNRHFIDVEQICAEDGAAAKAAQAVLIDDLNQRESASTKVLSWYGQRLSEFSEKKQSRAAEQVRLPETGLGHRGILSVLLE